VLGIIVASLTISWQFLRAWLTLYVQDFHQYDKFDTRLVQSGYFIVADLGCLLVGFLVKRLLTRGHTVHSARVTAFALYCSLTLIATAVPYLGGGVWMIAGLWIAGAGILGLHPLYYSLSQELPAKRMGTFSGLLAAGGWVISAVFQILIGDRIKETKSYDLAFLIAGTAPLIGLLALLLLWRSPDFEQRNTK
jgi:ACS family hexuronate transporter-like MFS transporter